MAEPLEARVSALEKKIEDIEGAPVSGSVEFRLSRQIKRLDHKIDLVAADLSELREEFADMKQDVSGLKQDVAVLKQDVSGLKQDVASMKDDNGNILALLNRLIDKTGA
jgi:archaellum component FlaC